MPNEFTNEDLVPSTPVCRTVKAYAQLIEEGSTADLTFTILDVNGTPIANTDIDSMTLTYVDEETDSVINTREDQDVLGAPGNVGDNDVTISVTADVTWAIQALDSIVVDPTETKNVEYHRAIFTIQTTVAAVTSIAVRQYRFPIRPEFKPLGGE